MQKCKPKFTLLLPLDMDGLNGGGGVERIDTPSGHPKIAHESHLSLRTSCLHQHEGEKCTCTYVAAWGM